MHGFPEPVMPVYREISIVLSFLFIQSFISEEQTIISLFPGLA